MKDRSRAALWTISFDGFYSSAFTWQTVQTATPADPFTVPYGAMFLEPRGSQDGDSAHALNLQLAKGFRVGRTRLVLIGSVYNALSNEYAISVCRDVSGCGQFQTGDYTDWVVPRSYELGFRVEF